MRMKRFLLVGAALGLAVAVLAAATPARAAGGELDRTFDSGGKVITHFAGAAGAEAVAVSGRRIIVGGSTGSRTVVAAYLPDGSLDSSFGRAGKLLPHVGAKGTDSALVDLAVTPGGGVLLLIAGGITYQTFLVRYGPNGHIDRAFGNQGKVRLDDFLQFPTGMALLPNGRIVVAGSDSPDVVVERVLPDGAPDPSFGSHGVVTTDVGGLQNLGGDVHVLSSGRILVVGASYVHCSPDCRDMLTMVRYLSNGELDHSFGKAGKVQFFTGGLFPEGSGLQSDGDIVVATSRAFDTSGCPDTIVASLIRFRPSGRLDTSFGSHGQVPVTTTDPKALAIRPNDGIVLGGWVCPALRAHLSVSVFGKDGAIDASFGADGTATVVVGPTDALAYAVGEQPDGKILAAGVTYRDIDHSSFAVVRFLAP